MCAYDQPSDEDFISSNQELLLLPQTPWMAEDSFE